MLAPDTMRHCSKRLRLVTITAALFVSLGLLWVPPASSQSRAPDPQKPLDVDRDPVLSPDIHDNEPGTEPPPSAAAPGTSSSMAKGDHGYVLRRDVEEVVLNATVLDDHDKLVMN